MLYFSRCHFKVYDVLSITTVLIYVFVETSQGGNFVRVVLSIDDSNYPSSQGIKRAEVQCIVIILYVNFETKLIFM